MSEGFETLKERIRNLYVLTDRDKQLSADIDDLITNAKECLKGYGTKRRALFVIGNTNSGKTLSLEQQFASRKEFEPCLNEHGEPTKPFLSMEVPMKPTSKEFAAAIFRALRLPSKVTGKSEGELYEELQAQLRERGILYIHFDEGQQIIRANTTKALQSAQDALRQLLQIKDWPLHIIISGVPPVGDLREGDGQIKSRSTVRPYEVLQCPADAKWIRHGLKVIAVDNCGMTLADDVLTDDFADRLCRSSGGAFGTIMEAIKEACLFTVGKGRKTLELKDFAKRYRQVNGCKPSANVFIAEHWRELCSL
ncbi:TniB family NTP-binding protein [Sinorhizobium fredii]|nr:TniB family NTP-binding protein [Sinorhizobium fredii]